MQTCMRLGTYFMNIYSNREESTVRLRGVQPPRTPPSRFAPDFSRNFWVKFRKTYPGGLRSPINFYERIFNMSWLPAQYWWHFQFYSTIGDVSACRWTRNLFSSKAGGQDSGYSDTIIESKEDPSHMFTKRQYCDGVIFKLDLIPTIW